MPLSSGCEQGYYPETTFGFFSKDHTLRKCAFGYVNGWVFESVSWAMGLMALLVFVLRQLPAKFDASDPYTVVEFVSYVHLGLEIMLKIAAKGFVNGAQTFVRSSFFNVLDFALFVGYWIEFALPVDQQALFTIRPLRVWR
jgi:hypothetical protein